MKISLETPAHMTIKKDNFGNYLKGGVFALVGLYFAYSWKIFDILSPKFFVETNNLIFAAFALIFIGLGVGIIITTKKILISLDKDQQIGSIANQSIVSTKKETFRLDEVKEIILMGRVEREEYRKSNRRGVHIRKYYNYSMEFSLKNNEKLPVEIDRIRVGALTNYDQEYEKRASEIKKIAEFLEVPLIQNKHETQDKEELE